MLREFGRRFSPNSFEKKEDRQAAQILIVIIIGAFVTCLLTALGGLYWQDSSVIQVGGVGILCLVLPLGLYVYKRLSLASFFTGLIVLIIVTVGASTGQGIHDVSIMGYPVIILIASLIMNRLATSLLFFLSVASIGWLVYGESYGLFIPHRTLRPGLVDFLIMASILAVAALIVNLQARNMRNNLKNARQEIVQRKTMEEQLRFLGTHDILTGVYNRQFFDAELTRLENSSSYPVSIIVADLDNLKRTNDTLGHDVGDELLKRASAALRQSFRAGDIQACIGGDEFGVLLPYADERAIQVIFPRLRTRINELNSAQPDLQVQLSFGAATAEKGDLAHIFRQADQDMYKAKSAHKAISAAPSAR